MSNHYKYQLIENIPLETLYLLYQPGTCEYRPYRECKIFLSNATIHLSICNSYYYVKERASKHEAILFVRGGVAPSINQIAECFDVLSLFIHSQT
jgi:hypothetical protein